MVSVPVIALSCDRMSQNCIPALSSFSFWMAVTSTLLTGWSNLWSCSPSMLCVLWKLIASSSSIYLFNAVTVIASSSVLSSPCIPDSELHELGGGWLCMSGSLKYTFCIPSSSRVSSINDKRLSMLESFRSIFSSRSSSTLAVFNLCPSCISLLLEKGETVILFEKGEIDRRENKRRRQHCSEMKILKF